MSVTHRIVVISGDLSYAVIRGIVEIERTIADVRWLTIRHVAQVLVSLSATRTRLFGAS